MNNDHTIFRIVETVKFIVKIARFMSIFISLSITCI